MCPVLKHDISQLAAEVSEQVLDGNNGGMERGGGIGEGRGRRMEVWDSRAEGGAGGWGSSQDECPSESIYSPPIMGHFAGP